MNLLGEKIWGNLAEDLYKQLICHRINTKTKI